MDAFNADENRTVEDELYDLISEMKPLEFTQGSQVTQYILQNDLKSKYGRLCGRLTMVNGEEQWTYEGGISPHHYAQVCKALGLGNHNSGARPGDFDPYRKD